MGLFGGYDADMYNAALNLSPEQFNQFLKQKYSASYGALNEFTKQKPYIYCYQYCPAPADHCESCRKEQEVIYSLIMELEKLEAFHKNPTPQVTQTATDSVHPKTTHCKTCGTPYSNGLTSCEVCGTPYELPPKVTNAYPESAIQRQQLIEQKAEELMRHVYQLRQTQYNYFRNHPGYVTLHQMPHFKDAPIPACLNYKALSEGANHYGVSIAAHIEGIARGTQKTIIEIDDEQFRAKQEEERQREKERKAQAQKELDEMTRPKPYVPYYGYTNSCCGNCRWFLRDGKCFQNGYNKSASDRCALYELK